MLIRKPADLRALFPVLKTRGTACLSHATGNFGNTDSSLDKKPGEHTVKNMKADNAIRGGEMTFKHQLQSMNEENRVYAKAEEKFIEHELRRKSFEVPSDAIDWGKAMEVIEKLEATFHKPKVDKEELRKRVALLSPTYNFAKVIEETPTLQRLVDLGIDISKWEENPNDSALALSLDFFEDVAPRIKFLAELGVHPDVIGHVITANPGIFRQDVDDLKVRVEDLKWKRFPMKSVARIVTRCPEWLNVPVVDIDSRLGYFQRSFRLTGTQIRKMVLRGSGANLVTWNGVHMQVERNKYTILSDMGFGDEGANVVLLNSPEVYMTDDEEILRETYELLKTMYTNEVILTCPEVLSCPILTLKPRHKFLQLVRRDQYDPSKPNFVSPNRFMIGSDGEFCDKVAKVPVELYNKFLLTV